MILVLIGVLVTSKYVFATTTQQTQTITMTDEDHPNIRVSESSDRGLPEPLANSLSQATGELLIRILGPASNEIGTHLGEVVKNWRFRRKNLEDISVKINTEIDRRGLDFDQLRPLPEGDAYRATDAYSLEDDEVVQKLWAGLITSAIDPNKTVTASKAFVDILKSIGPIEAGLLLVLQSIENPNIEKTDNSAKAISDARLKVRREISQLAEAIWRRFPSDQRDMAIQNLMRLRCIGFRTGKNLSERELMAKRPVGVRSEELVARADAVVKFFDYLENLALAVSGTGRRSPFFLSRNVDKELPESMYELTSLGKSLVRACEVDVSSFTSETLRARPPKPPA